MRRIVTVLVAVFFADLLWCLDARIAVASTSVGDGGSTISVSVSSSGSTGSAGGSDIGSPQVGPTSSGHSSSGKGTNTNSSEPPPDCTYELAPAVDQTGGGPPGAASP